MVDPVAKIAPVRNGAQAKSRRLGTLNRNAVTIFIFEEVFEAILAFSEEDWQREVGGFLVGSYCIEDSPPQPHRFIEIDHFLPAVDVKSNCASLTFTHDTWSKVNSEVHSRYPEKRIVGWHHTHPGLGVFLSEYDRFIHRNFFGNDWQVAMVVDPHQQELAFYQWQQDQLVDCGFVVVLEQDP